MTRAQRINARYEKILNTFDRHQLNIAMDTVKNPMKALLGGMSAEEAERLLREKFGWSENRIYGLKLHGEGERRRNR